MNTRTFDDVVRELEEEGHLVLAELVRAVASNATLGLLLPDCSHLRLLLRGPKPPYLEIMVAHQSAARRGQRTVVDRNALFELVIQGEREPKGSETIAGVSATVERLKELFSTQ